MSRIAKTSIVVPPSVEVKINGSEVTAKGPKGELGFKLSRGIEIVQNEAGLRVQLTQAQSAKGEQKITKHTIAMSGTTRAMIANLVNGVANGFERKLAITGVGYRAQVQGDKINLSLGFSHPLVYQLPPGVSAETPTQTEIILRSADKQAVGQVAAEIRSYRPPEPYKGKGVRYADEHIVRKQAKKK